MRASAVDVQMIRIFPHPPYKERIADDFFIGDYQLNHKWLKVRKHCILDSD
jgi:hypothetical protein